MEEHRANFERSMKRVANLVALHQRLHGRQGRPEQHVSDLLRGATVLAAGALDGLVLDLIVAGVPAAARKGTLGNYVAAWAKDDAAAVLRLFARPDPAEDLAAMVRTHLERTTFQKSAMIESNLRQVLGINQSPWLDAARRLNDLDEDETWTSETVCSSLDDFMRRRDRIAHSGDQKPNSGGANPIQRSWVERGRRLITAVGEATYEVVSTASL